MHHHILNTLIKMCPMLRTIVFPPDKKWIVTRLIEGYRHWFGVLSLFDAQLKLTCAAPSMHALSECAAWV